MTSAQDLKIQGARAALPQETVSNENRTLADSQPGHDLHESRTLYLQEHAAFPLVCATDSAPLWIKSFLVTADESSQARSIRAQANGCI
jgi:hypothetical protein